MSNPHKWEVKSITGGGSDAKYAAYQCKMCGKAVMEPVDGRSRARLVSGWDEDCLRTGDWPCATQEGDHTDALARSADSVEGDVDG